MRIGVARINLKKRKKSMIVESRILDNLTSSIYSIPSPITASNTTDVSYFLRRLLLYSTTSVLSLFFLFTDYYKHYKYFANSHNGAYSIPSFQTMSKGPPIQICATFIPTKVESIPKKYIDNPTDLTDCFQTPLYASSYDFILRELK